MFEDKEVLARAKELMGEGFHCSQAIMQLCHEERNIENKEVIRALAGLGGGMQSQKNCGALTGGSCLIASLGARGSISEDITIPYKDGAKALVSWFEKEFGSCDCKDLVPAKPEDKKTVCPAIVAKTYRECINILDTLGVDIHK